jgi:hypothetical protein
MKRVSFAEAGKFYPVNPARGGLYSRLSTLPPAMHEIVALAFQPHVVSTSWSTPVSFWFPTGIVDARNMKIYFRYFRREKWREQGPSGP